MLENLFLEVAPYMASIVILARTLAPFFVLTAILWQVIHVFYSNDKLDLNKVVLTPLIFAACIYFYPTLIKIYTTISDIIMGALPQPSLSWAEVWKEYKEGFGEVSWKNSIQIFTNLTSIGATIGTWLAVQLIGIVKAIISGIQLFFKVAVMLCGPMAFLMAILPTFRSLVKSWFTFLIYFTVWSFSIMVVDALAMGIFKSLLNNSNVEQVYELEKEHLANNGIEEVEKSNDYTSAYSAMYTDAKIMQGGSKALGGNKKTIAKSLKMLKTVKSTKGMMAAIGTASGAGLAIHVGGTIIFPFLVLFLYIMVPSMTRFFFQDGGMGNVLSAGIGFMTSKMGALQGMASKGVGAGSNALKSIQSRRNNKSSGSKEASLRAEQNPDIMEGRNTLAYDQPTSWLAPKYN